jgi:polar amino acid transport system permease protein
MKFDPTIITSHWPEILAGMSLTLRIWLGSSVLGMAIGLVLAAVQHYGAGLVGRLVGVYVTVFRGTPFLIQLFLLYYGGPSAGLVLSPTAAGILGLTIYSSAQFIEIFRSGFMSVPPGQIEAAQISGLTPVQTIQHVQIPQILLIILPSLVNMLIIMTKETAVLSVIAIPDLTAVLSGIGSATFAYTETLFALAAFYWILLELVTMAGRLAERRVGRYLVR